MADGIPDFGTDKKRKDRVWPEPLDFLADEDLTGAPELRPEHIPSAIAPFVFDTAARLGVDPAAVALSALVALSSVMDDTWALQPKQNDHTWTQNPRILGRYCRRPLNAEDANHFHNDRAHRPDGGPGP